ncbi:hypothetical protein [Nocardioides sp.]|uniref:Ig-like domain-containing protein n=1 Tax=Nocardioides sp. TaxID=35761 RepID=UPI002726730A|nr:hypothetical protein [Nocardioides sp.]MDO9456304.1 hypothetical protein [Nocardioides sp.]
MSIRPALHIRSLAPLLVGSLVGGLLVAPAATAPAGALERPPAQRAPQVLRHSFTYDGTVVRLDLRPVGIRSPGFQAFSQGADGTLTPRRVAPARAYLGGVVGQPGAVAVAIRRTDGVLAGQVTVDRGATVRFAGREVVETRGLTPPAAFAWPSAEDATRNVTVAPGQVGTATRRWDLGVDLDASYATGDLRRSIGPAMDAVDLLTVQLLATYERDARLRPALKRVVLRLDDAASPYAGVEGGDLGKVREEWTPALDADVVDDVALLHDEGGGGVAYVGTAGSDYAVSVNGPGADIDVVRHELGHQWGPGDNHTNGPEGATIESGNQYARFDGTELSSIFRRRDTRLADQPRRFPVVPTLRTDLPPYAALDLRDRLRSGVAVTLRPARNDHDANGTRVRLASVAGRSHLGGRVSRSGEVVTYVPPRVGAVRTVDWFTYRVVDPTGRPATGVVVVRVSPG